MKLPMAKPLGYLSPTSLARGLDCDFSLWLARCSGLMGRGKQTKPMAVGSAFDSFVKAEIARLLGKEDENKNLLATLLNNVDADNIECIPIGKDLFDRYNYQGCLRKLMDDGLTDIELDVKRDVGGEIVSGSEKMVGGVPIFAKPDAVLSIPVKGILKRTPIDWKVNGAFSVNGTSPKQGYKRCWMGGRDKGYHTEYGIPLEKIDAGWAMQLCIYSWVLDDDLAIYPRPVAIDQVAVRPTSISFAQFRTTISEQFQIELLKTMKEKWELWSSGEFKEPTPNEWMCEKYKTPRDCTSSCPYYQKWKTTPASDMDKIMRS